MSCVNVLASWVHVGKLSEENEKESLINVRLIIKTLKLAAIGNGMGGKLTDMLTCIIGQAVPTVARKQRCVERNIALSITYVSLNISVQ